MAKSRKVSKRLKAIGKRSASEKASRGGRPKRGSEGGGGAPAKKVRKVTASDGSTWVIKRVGDQEIIVQKTHEATRKPRFKRADFVWNPFYRSFKKNKKPAN